MAKVPLKLYWVHKCIEPQIYTIFVIMLSVVTTEHIESL